MKKKSLFSYIFLLILTWTASCYADNCSVDDWCKEYNPDTSNLYDIWGSNGKDIFAVGTNNTILHYDGSSWSTMLLYENVTHMGIWGSSENNVYAVGMRKEGTRRMTSILRYDGNRWYWYWDGATNCSMSTRNCAYFDVWGSSENDVFVVGDNWGIGIVGQEDLLVVIDHYDGNHWSAMASDGLYGTMEDIWGSSKNDVFAVATNRKKNYIQHYDGATWSVMESGGGTNNLYGVWGSSGSDVFAVGTNGTILHYDGSNWSEMTSGITNDLSGIWGSSGNDVFAVGDSGTILHRQLGPFKLSVFLPGNGTVTSEPQGIDCPTDCTETYAKNTSVRLTAVPSKGAIWGSWSSGECKVSGTSCTVIMNKDQEVTASFGKKGGIPWSMLLLKNRE